ncbi:MAG: thioredoxin family protein [Lewinella sp.]|nr:thioredoxin family protein [Lewinella sp.]
MKYLFLLIFTASTLTLLGQKTDCAALKSETVPTQRLDEDTVMLQVYQNIGRLTACGLDSVDVQILWESSFLSTLFVEYTTSSRVLTYGDIYNEYVLFSDNEAFAEMKQTFLFLQELEDRSVTQENWLADKEQLRQLGVEDSIIRAIEEKVNESDFQERSYRELFQEIRSGSSDQSSPDPPMLLGLAAPHQNTDGEYTNLEYEEARSLSREANKPLILFFTGHAAINAVKMEDNVLNDPSIDIRLKEEFVFVRLYVDERTKRESQQKTIGRLNLELQMNTFGANQQPFFVLLDVEGNVISTIGYTPDKTRFNDFLDEASEE